MYETHVLNKILNLILDKRYYARVTEWKTPAWTPYLDICRQQNFEAHIIKKYDSIDKIYVYSKVTGAIVGRYCIFNADVTELGLVLGAPGTYEGLFDNWTEFMRKFYRIEVSKLKPEYVNQKRKTLC